MADAQLKDRNQETEILRMVLNSCEVNISYIGCDLICRAQKLIENKNGNPRIDEIHDMHHKWKEDWDKYFNGIQKIKAEAIDNSNKEQ